MKSIGFSRALTLVVFSALVLPLFPTATAAQARKRPGDQPDLKTVPIAEASSSSSSLFMFTGGGASTGNGDFVSADGSGLDTYYSFFVEVPASSSELNVELFDADVGAGGAAEANAQRDRARGGFNSSVTYSLLDPSGVARPVNFNTGDTTLPAGSDNSWLSIFRGNGRNVGDNFGSAVFSSNDGTDNFAAGWIETDAGGAGAGAGSVLVTSGQLRISGNNNSLAREADLLGTPGLNLTNAFLNFTYNTSGNLDNADQVVVEVSNNGGGTWSTLNTFSNDSSGTAQYNISSFVANNTRIRFRSIGTMWTSGEFFSIDNVSISDGGGAITPGHWELRVDMSGTGGDDINALGIRAHDGIAGAGGTELNVYAAGMIPLGVNNPTSGTNTRSYTLFPYITSGCTCAKNDFDYDSDSGSVGSMSFTSGTGAFTQSFASANLSSDDSWSRGTVTGWATDTNSSGYGIWTGNYSISSYLTPAQNSNYTDIYMSSYAAAANPPTANPMANSFRIYLPTDAGTAPVKPYLSQNYVQTSGPNPLGVGQTGTMRVIVQFANPTAQAVTFSAANPVTANVPGAGAVYGGMVSMSQGSVVSQPAFGGTGNVVWNPEVVAAGTTVTMTYNVNVTPTSAGQRVPITATPASANGTRARYVDETGNTTQASATYTFGPICELGVTQGAANPVVSAAGVSVSGRVLTPDSRPVSNAIVTFTSFDGALKTARTNILGYFTFGDVPSGNSYVIAINSRRYTYQPMVLNVDDSIKGLEFTPIQ